MKPNFSNTEIAFKHLSNFELNKATFLFSIITKPFFVKLGKTSISLAETLRIPYGWALRKNIFSHFCAGTKVDKCDPVIQKLGENRCYSILDYSAEGLQGEDNFDQVCQEILKTLDVAKTQPYISYGVFKFTGMTSFELLEKVASGEKLTETEATHWKNALRRAASIYEKAAAQNLSIFVDAEDSWIQPAVDQMVYEMMPKFNTELPIVYTTIQMYRNEGIAMLEELIQKSKEGNFKAGVKLVRGAYMENERERALKLKYASPIHDSKQDTDNAFNQAVAMCIDNLDIIHVCVATHNEKSCELAIEKMKEKGIAPNDKRVAFAQLYGMSDHITFNLAHADYFVSKYLPYGPVEKVMPYLIRRAEENSSVADQSNREITNFRAELKRRKLKR